MDDGVNIMGLQVNVSKTEVVVFDGKNGVNNYMYLVKKTEASSYFVCLGRIFLKEGKIAKLILRCEKAG